MCRESDPELWFPFTRDADAVARSICRMCPVRQVCREYALEQRISYGVWGGLGEKERRVLLAEADRDGPTAGQPP
jgi:WhiB family redox-sensing transcriptional regulator